MYLKTKSGKNVYLPTPQEDEAITAAALGDPDAQPLSEDEFKRLRPMRGRPLGSGTKVQMTVRFDADVIDAFKQAGAGWQTKMNDALRDWLTKSAASPVLQGGVKSADGTAVRFGASSEASSATRCTGG